MELINENMFKNMKSLLSEMHEPVALTFFKPEGKFNDALLKHLSSKLKKLNPKLTIEIRVLARNDVKASGYGIKEAPAMVLEAKGKPPVRYFGIPVGEELNILLSDILSFSDARPGLSRDMNEMVRDVTFPSHLRVYNNPTGVFALNAVRMAHNFSTLNHQVAGSMHPETVMKKIMERKQ
ncbi:MAG: hypothetical protein Q7S22_02890 [Candidatus Micrarchaeota archaeon]|nr:hypothetical protein [Candidatus Micrarchaeota archaeon]